MLPPDRLCPAVTGRANYIRFVHALLASGTARTGPVWGADIGTGASAVYALLCARLHGWHVLATDTDAASLACARANVARNGLTALIETRLVPGGPAAPLVAPLLTSEHTLDFVLCNPPFFDSDDAAQGAHGARGPSPRRACTARESEACTPGGDAAFVRRLVDESVRVPLRCRWWTALLGRKRSLRAVWDYLHGGCSVLPPGLPLTIEEAELVQGRTARWVIAWSFFPPPETSIAPPAKRSRGGDCDGDESASECKSLLDTSKQEQEKQEQERKQG